RPLQQVLLVFHSVRVSWAAARRFLFMQVLLAGSRPLHRSISSPCDRSQQINRWHGISDWLKCHQPHN
ncbi:hypothetical protein XENOCAPTIV_001149, partial [Xenoophorus captivus]